MSKKLSLLLAVLVWAGHCVRADGPHSPFGVIASRLAGDTSGVRFSFEIPKECVLYADHLFFETDLGENLDPVNIPAPIMDVDKASGEERKMYDRSFTADLVLPADFAGDLVVKFQGCSNNACYFPEKLVFTVTANSVFAETKRAATSPVKVTPSPNAVSADWEAEAKQLRVVARETGYIRAADFVHFLQSSAPGHNAHPTDPLALFKRVGLVVTLLLIVGGGIALNLTPCVLPLIPVNLAIIGAGAQARTRREGFKHGAIYGAGMALVYGLLGLVVVLTGAKFGTLNSSVWFNGFIAVVFVVLGLAMFGFLNIDFSRYGGGFGSFTGADNSRKRSVATFLLGAVAALMAGACVAPVVISVLLLAADFYRHGKVIGLALPFLLGVGMALPWPFAGASLTFLPLPGKWMTWVKYGFGVLIVGLGIFYGHTAYALMQSSHPATDLAAAPGNGAPIVGANQSLTRGLAQARAQGRRVLVDFEASWCKNCFAMEQTVFNKPSVQQELTNFIVVKYQAERPNESPAKEVLDHFGVMGLPTFVILTPDK